MSLIIGPLESMIEKGAFLGDTERRMRLLARNATKMKMLVDELLFHQNQTPAEEKLGSSRRYISKTFHPEITDGFQPLAEERGIDFQVTSPQEGRVQAWFSPRCRKR